MKVYEIAKMVGLENADVANELGLEGGKGVHLKTVGDAEVKAYMASKGLPLEAAAPVSEEPIQVKTERKARFWSSYRDNSLPSRPDEARNDIRFADWTVECETDSIDAKWLRQDDIRDRMAVYEVLEGPYESTDTRVAFQRSLEGLIFTGQSHADGPSKEGMLKVRSMLWPDMLDELPKSEKNKAYALASAVAKQIHLSVESFGMMRG